MRILFVTNSIEGGGDTIAITNILKYLKHNGITAFVTCPKAGLFSKKIEKMNIPVLEIGNPLEIYPKIYSWKSYIKFPYNLAIMLIKRHKAYKKLCNCIKEFNPDIIHTNVGPVQIGYLAAKKFGIPHVWHIREYQKEDFNMIPFPCMNIFLKRIHDNNNHCICITKNIFKHFQLTSSKDIVIYDGVIDKRYVKEFNKNKKKYMLFVGRLEDAKGIKDLICAYNSYAENNGIYDLYIAGDGNKRYVDECKLLVDNIIKDRVFFLGACPHKKVYDLMYEASVLVVPSKNEGFGFITAEAMFNGTIVIGRNTGGTKEQFDNGQEQVGEEIGFRYDTTQQLIELLFKCQIIPPKKYEELSNRARCVVTTMYDVNTQSQKIMSFFSCIKKES